ncbi:replication protein C-like [Palleronia aestuarii]|uniref:Replication protein C-like n=1 Tax=Palleronia aestuarii TaxID=568105 RepID=A0A2W7N2A8_9RHOB|nr:replication initiation protein RepC [Palleronia aestuarii]PZX14190.1 replication protein C-like [Palleronia aestuarii]
MKTQSNEYLASRRCPPSPACQRGIGATATSRQRKDKPEDTDQIDVRPILYKAVRDAEYVEKISARLKSLLENLIRHVPHDAPSPISPASVEALVDKLGCKDRALRYKIATLVELGLVENRCLGNGRRHVQRNRRGVIVHIAGIDLSPLLEQADDLALKAAAKQDNYTLRAQLRYEISSKRAHLKRMLHTETLPDDLMRRWTDLPPDLAKLDLDELRTVGDKVDRLFDDITAYRQFGAGRPAISDPAYITDHIPSESCNRTIPAEKKGKPENRQPTGPATCGLENVSLQQVLQAAPQDWQVEMALHGQPSWQTFAGVASERARWLGIDPTAWSIAQAAIGAPGAAVIVMLGDAQSLERGGKVRSVGGWVRRMAERAENGTAHLNRTLFGLLNKETELC